MIQKGVSSPAPRRARASDARTRTRSSSSKASSASRSAYQVFPASPVRRSHSLPQTAIRGTPKKAAVNSSAFGRSERNKAPPCVEMWGPLGAKQKVAADTAPLHLRPGMLKSFEGRGKRVCAAFGFMYGFCEKRMGNDLESTQGGE